jgi:hypothetical protein
VTAFVYPSPRDGALPFTAATLGIIVAVLALPLVLLAGGPFAGWMLGVALWIGNWSLQLMTSKVSLEAKPTAAVGIAGISLMTRAWVTAIILFVVALRISEPVALAAAGVFLAAFTFDLTGRALLYGMMERDRPPAGTTTES